MACYCTEVGGSCACGDKGLSLNDYQKGALSTDATPEADWDYFILGVAGEAGELVEQLKKWIRDDEGEELSVERGAKLLKELGDVLWYVALVADRLEVPLSLIGEMNLKKLADRQAAGTIKGEGDDR